MLNAGLSTAVPPFTDPLTAVALLATPVEFPVPTTVPLGSMRSQAELSGFGRGMSVRIGWTAEADCLDDGRGGSAVLEGGSWVGNAETAKRKIGVSSRNRKSGYMLAFVDR